MLGRDGCEFVGESGRATAFEGTALAADDAESADKSADSSSALETPRSGCLNSLETRSVSYGARIPLSSSAASRGCFQGRLFFCSSGSLRNGISDAHGSIRAVIRVIRGCAVPAKRLALTLLPTNALALTPSPTASRKRAGRPTPGHPCRDTNSPSSAPSECGSTSSVQVPYRNTSRQKKLCRRSRCHIT